MQSTMSNALRHAFGQAGHALRESWESVKDGARRLLPARSRAERRDAGHEVQRYRNGLDRLFWKGGPRLEVGETNSELVLRVDMPGLRKDEFSVEIDDRFVTLRAEQRSSRQESRRGYSFSEQSYGSYARTIPLPCGVDGDKAKAKYRRGQLTVTLPKASRSSAVTIPVQG